MRQDDTSVVQNQKLICSDVEAYYSPLCFSKVMFLYSQGPWCPWRGHGVHGGEDSVQYHLNSFFLCALHSVLGITVTQLQPYYWHTTLPNQAHLVCEPLLGELVPTR